MLGNDGRVSHTEPDDDIWRGDSRDWHDKHPGKSAWLGAYILSFAWTGIYFLVFFLFTWFMDLSTPSMTLIVGLWLSIIAEAYIRYLENSDNTAKFNKPLSKSRKGDNQDFTAGWSRQLIFGGLIVLFFMGWVLRMVFDIDYFDPKVQSNYGIFKGQQGDRGLEAFFMMVTSWITAMKNVLFLLGLLACLTYRALIYKRSTKKILKILQAEKEAQAPNFD